MDVWFKGCKRKVVDLPLSELEGSWARWLSWGKESDDVVATAGTLERRTIAKMRSTMFTGLFLVSQGGLSKTLAFFGGFVNRTWRWVDIFCIHLGLSERLVSKAY